MKIAFISDIHSNLSYFRTIIPSLETVDQIFCLGDIIGYYDRPNEVIKTCMDLGIRAIKGNHEKYFFRERKYEREKEHVYGIARQRIEIEEDCVEWLRSLPDHLEITIGRRKLYLTHSLPDDPVTYCYDPRQLDESFTSRYDFYCFGHTHIPSIQYFFGTCIINPGSVGQPRDYTGKPSFVIVDFLNDVCFLHKARVDRESYQAQLAAQQIDQVLIDILERGKHE